jgi:hypothetical protein
MTTRRARRLLGADRSAAWFGAADAGHTCMHGQLPAVKESIIIND